MHGRFHAFLPLIDAHKMMDFVLGGADDEGKASGEGQRWQSAATHRYLDW
jgi:hypothetical protein